MISRDLIVAARAAGRSALLEPEAKAVLREFGIDVPRSVIVRGAEGIHAVAELRPPYALKVISPAILHKSDVGGVVLHLDDIPAVERALGKMVRQEALQSQPIEGFLIEEMAPKGHELVIGGTLNPQFGPIVMVGLGGVFVEVLNDVSFRICPIDVVDAAEMIEELRSAAVLRGARGGIVASEEAIEAALMAIGGDGGLLMELGGEISELDINPLVVDSSRACAVDARIVLGLPAVR